MNAVAAGGVSSCALLSTGAVKCWGAGYGERAVDVAGVSGLTAIAGGFGRTCGITAAGGVVCWSGYRTTPSPVGGIGGTVTALALGYEHTCVLTSAGSVKCWGWNRWGQLGDGTTTDRPAPVDVRGLGEGVKAIAAGYVHTCALTSNHGVKCWGDDYGAAPDDVPGLRTGIAAIASGDFHTCAVTAAGGVKCWGSNGGGQLGDGTASSRPTPVGVSGLDAGVTALAAGELHTCALTSAGGVDCWGLNAFGQLGEATPRAPLTPVGVSGLTSGVTAITAGTDHNCALTKAGAVECWGRNSFGQLGDGTTTNRRHPVEVAGLGAAVATLALVSRSVPVSTARVAAIALRCGSAAPCTGNLTLTSRGRRLGGSAFSIGQASTQAVGVKLTRPAFRLLVHAKRLAAVARIDYAQPAGGTTKASGTITLLAPKTR